MMRRGSRGPDAPQLNDGRPVLTVVKPDTLIRWHRQGFRLFWWWNSRPQGRPPIPVDVPRLIATMATANVTWDEERIAAELEVKVGIPALATNGAPPRRLAATAEGSPCRWTLSTS